MAVGDRGQRGQERKRGGRLGKKRKTGKAERSQGALVEETKEQGEREAGG